MLACLKNAEAFDKHYSWFTFPFAKEKSWSEEIWRSTSAIRTGAGPGSPCRPAYSTGLIPLKPVWHGPRAGLRRAILPNFAHGTARTLFFSIGKSLSAAQRLRGADETGLWFGIVALVASGLSLQDCASGLAPLP